MRHRCQRRRFARRGGFAVLLVLIAAGIAAVLAAGTVDSARTVLASGNAARIQGDGALAAEAGLRLAAIRMAGGATAAAVEAASVDWHGWTVRVAVEDEAGKVDANRGSPLLLAAVLRGLDVPAAGLARLADARRRRFVAVDELAGLIGLDRAGADSLARLVTVHGDQVVDLVGADPALVRAAGASGLTGLLNVTPTPGGGSRLQTYRLRAVATRGAATVRSWLIVRLTPGTPRPFEWLEAAERA